jgi:hypothetical protein
MITTDQIQTLPADYYRDGYRPYVIDGAPPSCRLQIPLVFIARTPRALLFELPDRRKRWFPASQARLLDCQIPARGELVTVSMPCWLAAKVWPAPATV